MSNNRLEGYYWMRRPGGEWAVVQVLFRANEWRCYEGEVSQPVTDDMELRSIDPPTD